MPNKCTITKIVNELIGCSRCCRVSALCVYLVKVTKIRLRKKNSNNLYFLADGVVLQNCWSCKVKMKSNLTMSCQLTLYVDCRRGIRLSSHGVRYRTLNNSPRTIVFLYENNIWKNHSLWWTSDCLNYTVSSKIMSWISWSIAKPATHAVFGQNRLLNKSKRYKEEETWMPRISFFFLNQMNA